MCAKAAMEADWEIELGTSAPVIDASWAGLVDLRASPERVHEITETHLLPGLADALVRLNARTSTVWTAKCDVWRVEEAIDPFELDAEPDETTVAMACYIDLLPRSDRKWHLPVLAAAACRAIAERLRAIDQRACRVDLIVRLAQVAADSQALGITAYATACAVDERSAQVRLAAAVAALTDAATGTEGVAESESPVQ